MIVPSSLLRNGEPATCCASPRNDGVLHGKSSDSSRCLAGPMPVRPGPVRDRYAGALGLARSFGRQAAARMARPMRPMSAAGASAFASPGARRGIARYEDKATKAVRSFCTRCGSPLTYERARSPHMVNIPRALFSGRTGRQPLYHIAIEELQEWAYTGEPLVPLKGFSRRGLAALEEEKARQR